MAVLVKYPGQVIGERVLTYRVLAAVLVLFSALVMAQSPAENATKESVTGDQLLAQANQLTHTRLLASSDEQVLDAEIGLGAIKKVRGVWRFKHSQRMSAQRLRYTWQVLDGFSADEVFDGMTAMLSDKTPLFACHGRDCGSPVQWANRVFGQRILYGRDDVQRYAIYELADNSRALFYAGARTAQRQYFHMEIWIPITAKPL